MFHSQPLGSSGGSSGSSSTTIAVVGGGSPPSWARAEATPAFPSACSAFSRSRWSSSRSSWGEAVPLNFRSAMHVVCDSRVLGLLLRLQVRFPTFVAALLLGLAAHARVAFVGSRCHVRLFANVGARSTVKFGATVNLTVTKKFVPVLAHLGVGLATRGALSPRRAGSSRRGTVTRSQAEPSRVRHGKEGRCNNTRVADGEEACGLSKTVYTGLNELLCAFL